MKRKIRVLAIVCIVFFLACAVLFAFRGNVAATSGYAFTAWAYINVFILAGGIVE